MVLISSHVGQPVRRVSAQRPLPRPVEQAAQVTEELAQPGIDDQQDDPRNEPNVCHHRMHSSTRMIAPIEPEIIVVKMTMFLCLSQSVL